MTTEPVSEEDLHGFKAALHEPRTAQEWGRVEAALGALLRAVEARDRTGTENAAFALSRLLLGRRISTEIAASIAEAPTMPAAESIFGALVRIQHSLLSWQNEGGDGCDSA